jgi:anti-anti-sigma factor
MPVVASTKKGICRLRVEDDMTIYTAADLKQQLLPRLAKCKEMELDLSGVNEMDSAGLQLLVLLKREAKEKGIELRMTAHGPAVTSVIDTCNMAAYFGDPIVLQTRQVA